jgi:hypothetical protein
MNSPEVDDGITLLESTWYLLAVKIVELAIHVYHVPPEQASALKDVFLKQNEYYVTLT